MIQLSQEDFNRFIAKFKCEYDTTYKHLRLGQAFYQHFKLERVNTARNVHDRLYQLDGDSAMCFIGLNFEFI